jgi:hypothetical protein
MAARLRPWPSLLSDRGDPARARPPTEHLSECPPQEAIAVACRSFANDLHPSLDDRRHGKPRYVLRRISQRSTEFVARFAHDAFGIDREPAAALVIEDVVMVEIAMQEPASTL